MTIKNFDILAVAQHLTRELISAGHITTVDETIAAVDKFAAALLVTSQNLQSNGLELSEKDDDD